MALDFNFGDLEQKLTGLSRKVSNELTDKALGAGGDIVIGQGGLIGKTGHGKKPPDGIVYGEGPYSILCGRRGKVNRGLLQCEPCRQTVKFHPVLPGRQRRV